ncbi:dynein heavy chain, N-terminal region 2-domain-containing protein [Baffinella frigidus]|nr:dynein heavy chain, N-terminal region 2-domain-containing protein [Cryptophyta sp. CCMP2293]
MAGLIQVPHLDYKDTLLLFVRDSLLESLKSNIAILQGMQASKYVQGNPAFLEQATAWQAKLGTVDSTISLWIETQTRWAALANIFLDSADIEDQLPLEAVKFREIHEEMQWLNYDASKDPRAVECCNHAG